MDEEDEDRRERTGVGGGGGEGMRLGEMANACRAATAYRRDEIHCTATAKRTRMTNVVVDPLLPTNAPEPLYVSSSFLTTSLGCLSYSAADETNKEKKTNVNIFERFLENRIVTMFDIFVRRNVVEQRV